MINREEFQSALDTLLQPHAFKDYCPNGLQVEGRGRVGYVVSGVTASLALIDAAIAAGADTLLVHHGLFWRGQDGRIVGWMRQRLARLLAHNINLFAYHLPLDAHPELGNNAQLGARLGVRTTGHFGDQELGCLGEGHFADVQQLVDLLQSVLGRSVLHIPGHTEPIRRIAWCSGGAQSYFEAAIAAGAQVFISGEVSEPQVHLARECGVAYLACGHHATERYGVQAVAEHLARQFNLQHTFIDIDNPV